MNTLTKNIVISIIVSIAFHAVMFGVVSRVSLENMPGLKAGVEQIDEERLPIELKSLTEEELEKMAADAQRKDAERGIKTKEDLFNNEAADKAVSKVFEQQKLNEPAAPAMKFTGIETKVELPKQQEAPAPVPTAPRPEIVSIDMSKVPLKDRNASSRVTIPQVERTDVADIQLPSLLPHGPMTATASTPIEIGMRMNKPQFGLPRNVGDEEAARGVTGVYKGSETALRIDGKINGPEGTAKAVPFDDFVNIHTLVKEDPKTGGGYFMISISANENSAAVQEIPKDVLLAIDRSSSISLRQFSVFKEASYNTLNALKPTDRFNVVTFTSKPVPRFTTFVPATEENKKLAVSFIRRLENRGTTSVFGAIEPFIKNAQAQTDRPLNIFLMTDGVSTVNIYNDNDFLRQVGNINPGHVSIFPFSVGKKANLALLDFLGFQNRGASLHTTTVDEARQKLSNFITKHNNLLIRNLEYVSDANTVREIYPRKLQHLYKDSDVKLYGKYAAGEKSIILDIVGYDAGNQRRNMIFQCVFAECQRTNEPLETIWAGRKLLDLVSEKMVATDDATQKETDAQIRETSDKYNLAVPY